MRTRLHVGRLKCEAPLLLFVGAAWFLPGTGLFGAELPSAIRTYLARSGAKHANQLLVAAGERFGTHKILLYSLKRNTQGAWVSAFRAVPATIGTRGFAPPGEKREGDGRSPSGVYPLGFAFGYFPPAGVRTKLPYRQVTTESWWDTEPGSPTYNTWRVGPPTVESFEWMRRRDEQYRLGLVIEYNMNPTVAGHGSAIFLHIWRGPNLPTAGCVGVSERDARRILDWLNPADRPMIVMGPLQEFRAGRL